MSNTGRASGSAGERRLLGLIASKVQTGHVVVKLGDEWRDKLPRIGWRVELGGDGISGILVDIIGNVREPYAVVKLEDRSLLEKVSEGSEAYVIVPRPRPRRRQRRPGRLGAARGGRRRGAGGRPGGRAGKERGGGRGGKRGRGRPR